MKKLFVSFLLVNFSHLQTYAQNVEQSLFVKLCTQVEKLNYYSAIKDEIPGTVLLIDPVSGIFDIKYGNQSAALTKFKKRQKNEQIEILKSISLPCTPLNDTVYVVDSSREFSHTGSHNVGRTFFTIVRKFVPKEGRSQIGIDKISLDGDDLILRTFFSGSSKMVSFIFTIDGAGFRAKGNFITDLNR